MTDIEEVPEEFGELNQDDLTVADLTTAEKATELLRLHEAPQLLKLVNVWDVISAQVVAAIPGTQALATASHSIAASHGYPDGEHISRVLMIDAVARIAASVKLPVTADLEAGYGDVGETISRAIDVGVVGANLEDQLKPLPDAVRAVADAVEAGERAGVRFVLNARTDAFLLGAGKDPAAVLADAIERGRAYLEAGAACFFVPGKLDEATVSALVDALGRGRISVIAVPGSLSLQRLEELGVARVSYGPYSQNVALTALAELTEGIYAGGELPANMRRLN
ncbi:2-Methylisocitrate lyase, PEP mutase family [Frankineae bacterium MT45]|nr:2-Methylisocitrate lyase, PEP mutase family [Frankineae bacterium MT45]